MAMGYVERTRREDRKRKKKRDKNMKQAFEVHVRLAGGVAG